MNGSWIVPFKGRNYSSAYALNFLWRSGCVYVMDNHRVALWCWLQELKLDRTHSLLHIDRDTETVQSQIDKLLDNLPASWDLTIDEYLHHAYEVNKLLGEVPVFGWDNYLSIYFAKFSDAIKRCYFATHEERNAPNFHGVYKVDLWNLPNCFSESIDKNQGPWIVNIDLDYFFWKDWKTDVMVSEAYLSACFKPLRKKIDDGTVKALTISLTPHEEYTGGWENSENLATRILAYLGIDFHLPES